MVQRIVLKNILETYPFTHFTKLSEGTPLQILHACMSWKNTAHDDQVNATTHLNALLKLLLKILIDCDIQGQPARVKLWWIKIDNLWLMLHLLTSYLPVWAEQFFQILLFHVGGWQIPNKNPSLQISRIITAAGARITPWWWTAASSAWHNRIPRFTGFFLRASQMLENFWFVH